MGKTSHNEFPDMTLKKSDGEALVILKFWGMQSTLSLPLLSGPLKLWVVAPNRVRSMGQIELFDIKTVHKQMTSVKFTCLII